MGYKFDYNEGMKNLEQGSTGIIALLIGVSFCVVFLRIIILLQEHNKVPNCVRFSHSRQAVLFPRLSLSVRVRT